MHNLECRDATTNPCALKIVFGENKLSGWCPRQDLNTFYRRGSGMAKRNFNKLEEHGRVGWRPRNSREQIDVSPADQRPARRKTLFLIKRGFQGSNPHASSVMPKPAKSISYEGSGALKPVFRLIDPQPPVRKRQRSTSESAPHDVPILRSNYCFRVRT